MHRLLVVLIAACGGTTPAPAVATPATVADTYCPEQHLGVWAAELFPGCAPPPFEDWQLPLCTYGACPRPCNEIFASDELGAFPQPIAAFAYDAQGRWTTTTLAGGADVTTGRYAARLMSTANAGFVDTATRDARGRITRLVRDGAETVIAWDGDDVRGVGAVTIERDAQHRIARVGDVLVERDAQGRATKAGTRTFAYDARGLVRRDAPAGSLEVERDAQGRIEQLVEHHPAGDNGHMLLNYDCE